MTDKTGLEFAKSYINYGIKEGYFDESQFEGMSNKKLIEFANDASARADAEADRAIDKGDPEAEQEKTEALADSLREEGISG